MTSLNKLHIYFYNSDNTTTRKLQMFNAVLRAKMMYGLETIVMNTRVLNMLDTFQLKCLRKILQIPTTYIDRQYSNAVIRQQVNDRLKAAKKKPMETLTEFHNRMRISYLIKLIKAGDSEPGTSVTLNPTTLEEIEHGKKRVGQPKKNWFRVAMQDLWVIVKKNIQEVQFAFDFDYTNQRHVDAVHAYVAKQ